MPGTVIGAISAGTAVFNAVEGHKAATTAANQQVAGAQQAVGLETPAMTVGNSAAAKLASMYGLSTTPPAGSATVPAIGGAGTVTQTNPFGPQPTTQPTYYPPGTGPTYPLTPPTANPVPGSMGSLTAPRPATTSSFTG
jgi:hypothetical protein